MRFANTSASLVFAIAIAAGATASAQCQGARTERWDQRNGVHHPFQPKFADLGLHPRRTEPARVQPTVSVANANV